MLFNPTALRKAKIVCNFGFSECNRVKVYQFLEFLLYMEHGIYQILYGVWNKSLQEVQHNKTK